MMNNDDLGIDKTILRLQLVYILEKNKLSDFSTVSGYIISSKH